MIATCLRPDSHLTYMIDIALTTEFAVSACVRDDQGGPDYQVFYRRAWWSVWRRSLRSRPMSTRTPWYGRMVRLAERLA
jgi:hypothetical protein